MGAGKEGCDAGERVLDSAGVGCWRAGGVGGHIGFLGGKGTEVVCLTWAGELANLLLLEDTVGNNL